MTTEQQIEWLRQRVAAIASRMRTETVDRKYVNPSHVLGYADELEQALADAKAGEPRHD